MSLHTCLHSPYSLCRSFILCTCLVLHILHLFAQSIFFTINILSLFVQSIFCICLHSPYFVLVAHTVFSFAQHMFCLFVCPALYLFCTVYILCLFACSIVGFCLFSQYSVLVLPPPILCLLPQSILYTQC